MRSAPNQLGCARRLRKTADGSKKMLLSFWKKGIGAGASSTVRPRPMKLNPKSTAPRNSSAIPGPKPTPSFNGATTIRNTTPATTYVYVRRTTGETSLQTGWENTRRILYPQQHTRRQQFSYAPLRG